jgi:2-polyprenyl-6-hydroxyphenyl methylase/3-demethylubiquinone-9 3-methyltransferase
MTLDTIDKELADGERFRFGENWAEFLERLDDTRIAEAEKSLKEKLGVDSLAGLSFLDIGCGSGLFSLAARRLGAVVRSFDYDPVSAACAMELKKRFFLDDGDWKVDSGSGSILDDDYVDALGLFDVVYSWGVLHHTGNMTKALDNAGKLARDGGLLFISIYNTQWATGMWKKIKRFYNKSPGPAKRIMGTAFYWYVAARGAMADIVSGKDPRERFRGVGRRGMNIKRDALDWLGGYPFQTARPDEIFRFYRDRGFTLVDITTRGGGSGCNEFVFRKTGANTAGSGF